MHKNYFIIGDVHGCLNTFKELVDRYWDKENEVLIQLGDLIDRGSFSPQTLYFSEGLEKQNPEKVKILRGNHEQMALDYYDDISTSWLANGGRETLFQFEAADREIKNILPWIRNRKLYIETEHMYISHAGLSLKIKDTEDPRHPDGLLWNRGPLKNLGKVQIIGHTPLNTGKPSYSSESNSWNIDTGAYKGICLSGIKLNNQGKFLDYFSIPTHNEDLL